MAQPSSSLGEQLTQLEAARNLVLGDPALYPQIVQGVLPIIGVNARLELRRWGAEFLAETFSTPVLAAAQKEQLADTVLPTLQELLDQPSQDLAVVKSVVQTAASFYPHVFRQILRNPDNGALWERMTSIKQNILQRWDTAPTPVKVCCIKFAQKVVQVQTPGTIADPRRPDQNETSLAIVPRNHALLSLPSLEAEASGLLDRILLVFQENSTDAIIVNATLTCLAVLIRSRQSVGTKILTTILNFDPLQQLNTQLTPTIRVSIKSMERTTRALLVNTLKRTPGHPLSAKMQQYIDRLAQPRAELMEDSHRSKRGPPELIDDLDPVKRQRLGADTPPPLKVPPLPEGPVSFDQLFTLTEDVGLSSFDVKQLPADMIVNITVAVLSRVDPGALSQAIDAIRGRYQTLITRRAAARAPAGHEEEDDYEPEYQPMDVADNVASAAEAVSAAVPDIEPELVSLGPFVLPQPPPLTEEEAADIGRGAVERVFAMYTSMPPPQKSAKGPGQQQLGFSRLAGSSFDRDAWAVLLARLATRASNGLDLESSTGKTDIGNGVVKKKPMISDAIREMLYRHILEDFRGRINIGITWLNEEWYNDCIQMKYASAHRGEEEDISVPLHYDHWVQRLLDGILPYLDARDKILIRFLSEIPDVTIPIVARVKSLARDPERVNLCVQALLYLVMFRPPARDICLDALEEIYTTYEEARPAAGKILTKWRPEVVAQNQQAPPLVTMTAATAASPSNPVNAPTNGVVLQS